MADHGLLEFAAVLFELLREFVGLLLQRIRAGPPRAQLGDADAIRAQRPQRAGVVGLLFVPGLPQEFAHLERQPFLLALLDGKLLAGAFPFERKGFELRGLVIPAAAGLAVLLVFRNRA